MAQATRTTNPIPLGDLEPHRFEDLIRQLIYSFRQWDRLEATGRSGSDEGFDIRGIERIRLGSLPSDAEDDEQDEEFVYRTWLIQCKREKSIGPQKISTYVRTILKDTQDPPHALLFAVACDLSKKARDEYIKAAEATGVSEAHIMARSEIEDLLFQPQNDHLLFAYFGISNVIKRRSIKTQLRSRLATKKKAIRVLGNVKRPGFSPILLRDPEENRYPFWEDIPGFRERPSWKPYYFRGHDVAGLSISIHRYMAFVDDDAIHYDYMQDFDCALPGGAPDVFCAPVKDEKWHKAEIAWLAIPDRNRAWFEVLGLVSYDSILAIDEDGDKYFTKPHIYVPFINMYGPFDPSGVISTVNLIWTVNSKITSISHNQRP